MKVSIITPCFNSEKTIRQTIESVLNHTYKNIEYIIVDGGSTDGTLSIIREYIPLFKGRLKYISEKDNGVYDAMNKGIRMSRGQLIGIINSDDFYELQTVEKVMQYFDICKKQVIYGYLQILEPRKRKYIVKNRHQNLKDNMIPHPTCFLSRNVYREYGLFSTKYKIVSDYELMLRLKKSNKIEFIQIPEILANFRAGGISSSKKTIFEKNLVRLKYGYITKQEFLNFLLEYLS